VETAVMTACPPGLFTPAIILFATTTASPTLYREEPGRRARMSLRFPSTTSEKISSYPQANLTKISSS
jgi:hypothetical protein